VTWISTCTDDSQCDPAFLHLFKDEGVQCCAYAVVLIVRMHGKQFNFSGLIITIQCIGDKSSDCFI